MVSRSSPFFQRPPPLFTAMEEARDECLLLRLDDEMLELVLRPLGGDLRALCCASSACARLRALCLRMLPFSHIWTSPPSAALRAARCAWHDAAVRPCSLWR